jgi:hypothetical protein
MKFTLLMNALVLAALFAVQAQADQTSPSAADSKQQQKQQLLQRVYQMRLRYEQERAQQDNNARANVRLITNSGRGVRSGVDSPTVTGLRQQTNQQLARFESQFQCLDVEVEANSGNTVVICGDNTGDISGTNVSADRDIVTINGGTP